MNTCATCKYWEAPTIAFDRKRGLCREIVEIANNPDDDAGETAVLHAYEGPELRTRADFGCTLWQARDGVLGNMMTDGRSSWPKESE